MENLFFTLISNIDKPKVIKVGRIIKLVKEIDNAYDDEAIHVEMRYIGKIGYIANSVHTVVRGTRSAGRLYDKITDTDYGKIRFITKNEIICKLLTPKEIEEEQKNKDSDIHYLE